MESFQQIISIHYAAESFEKLLSMDYGLLESFEGRQKFERCQSFAMHGSRSDDGCLVQFGPHEELIQDTDGRYYALWNAQAKYFCSEM